MCEQGGINCSLFKALIYFCDAPSEIKRSKCTAWPAMMASDLVKP